MQPAYDTRFPSIEDLRARSARRVPRFVFEYLDGGCNEDTNLRRNREDLERTLGPGGVAHTDVDPGQLVERGWKVRRRAGHRLIALDRLVELVGLVVEAPQGETGQVDDLPLLLGLGGGAKHLSERLDRARVLVAEGVDDPDEVPRLREVRAPLLHGLERLTRLL